MLSEFNIYVACRTLSAKRIETGLACHNLSNLHLVHSLCSRL